MKSRINPIYGVMAKLKAEGIDARDMDAALECLSKCVMGGYMGRIYRIDVLPRLDDAGNLKHSPTQTPKKNVLWF